MSAMTQKRVDWRPVRFGRNRRAPAAQCRLTRRLPRVERHSSALFGTEPLPPAMCQELLSCWRYCQGDPAFTILRWEETLGAILPCSMRSRLRGELAGANRESPPRPDEMAGIAGRIPFEVILMLRFGLPELGRANDFRHHLSPPQTGSIDVGDCVFGDAFLLVARVEDRRAIAAPDVVTLTVARARVVDLKEELEELPVANPRRIEDD